MWKNNFLISTAFLIIISIRIGTTHAQDVKKEPNGFQDCFARDSISCIQMQIFRKARDFFAQEKIDLIAGISLTKESTSDERNGKSSENVLNDQQLEKATDVEDREAALESYLWTKAKSFLTERSITWNPSQTARSLAESIPENVKEDFANLVEEGRGKKKKLKKIIPLLIALKIKMVLLLLLGYLIVALIAKKAIVASLISLAISGYIALKKILAKKHDHHHEESYHVGYGGGYGHSAPSYGGGGGWPHEEYGGYGSHSQPVAQQIAYNGQKHK